MRAWLRVAWPGAAILLLAGCRTLPLATGEAVKTGDEIIVAGRRFHTGTRVITWQDPGGYDGYAGLPPFAPRHGVLDAAGEARVSAHGWTVPELQRAVDQFVLHYDVCGVSKVCFKVLHERGLSVHFLLDVDGTVYQTIDLQERALHATIANSRSIGIEIANIGAYPPGAAKPLDEWYEHPGGGETVLRVPARIGDPGIATPHFTGGPARATPVRGRVQDETLVQYDFTPQQYAALTRLTAALCRIFPRIACDYPHTWTGRPIAHKLPDGDLANYHGILGHYHIQANKADPGPAFQWRRFIAGVRAELK
ncbi:MAG TPA: N-acetylmuramoyl-L-alanine amidase [Opitutus sp.]|nr:N-acetylmuramoyl-L-alanine amidase [Opitutus sp.]